jgi:hypothetical protein
MQSDAIKSTKFATNLDVDDGEQGYYFVKLIVGGTLRLDYETLDLTIDTEDRSMTISSPLLRNSELNEMSIEMPTNTNLAICMRYFYELDSEEDSEED